MKQVDVLQTLDVQSKKNQGPCKLNYCKSIAIVIKLIQINITRIGTYHIATNTSLISATYFSALITKLTVVQSCLSWNSYCEARS